MAPVQFQVLGERHSGTNFVSKLINRNVQNLKETNRFGWKHGLYSGMLCPSNKNRHRNPFHRITTDHPATVFVVVCRNPSEWLRSMHKKPWHLDLWNLPFDKFIRKIPLTKFGHIVQPTGPLVKSECINPRTRQLFPNIIEMRNAKYRAWLALETKVKYFFFVNYNQVIQDPSLFLDLFCKKFTLQREPTFDTIPHYKGNEKEYKIFIPTPHKPITGKDLRFIQAQLDSDQETKMGFGI